MRLSTVLTLASVIIVTASQSVFAQTSTNIPVEKRNYAQKLGGYAETDYTIYEGTVDCQKKKNKHLIDEVTFSSYEEAFKNLPSLPDPSEIDTEEKMVEFLNKIAPYHYAIEKHEPHDQMEQLKDEFNKAMMDNAKRAAKGLPYDTEVHIDPKYQQYLNVLNKKMVVLFDPVYKSSRDVYTIYEMSDPGYFEFVNQCGLASEKKIFNVFAPLRKQMCKEWFASAACKKIASMDKLLVDRAIKEAPLKSPEWFIEGRKAEQEVVKAYNQQLCKRWIEKIRPRMLQDKADLAKQIALLRELEKVRGNDEITKEFVGMKLSAVGIVETYFHRYYSWLEFVRLVPLVKSPDTMEKAKKFSL